MADKLEQTYSQGALVYTIMYYSKTTEELLCNVSTSNCNVQNDQYVSISLTPNIAYTLALYFILGIPLT